MHPNVGTATLMWDLREIEQKKLQQKNSACGLHGVDIVILLPPNSINYQINQCSISP